MIISENIQQYFAGEYHYSHFKTESYKKFVDKVEREVIEDLLGFQVAKQFFADLVLGTPASQKWIDFVNGKYYQHSRGFQLRYLGILGFLQNYCLSEFIRKFETSNTGSGRRILDTKNSNAITGRELKEILNQYYNTANVEYCHSFIFVKSQNETIKYTASSVNDNIDGTYTFAIANTEFLNNFSEVFISGKKFEVSNLVLNTSFDITAISGQTFALDFEFRKYGELMNSIRTDNHLIRY